MDIFLVKYRPEKNNVDFSMYMTYQNKYESFSFTIHYFIENQIFENDLQAYTCADSNKVI